MLKKIDWKGEEARARTFSIPQLCAARLDAAKTAKLWNDPDTDPDGNYGFYIDQVSVYRNEIQRRADRKNKAKANRRQG